MPEEKKVSRPTKVVPKDLPMPRYDYQKPDAGSYTVRYDEKRERERDAGGAKAPALLNLNKVKSA